MNAQEITDYLHRHIPLSRSLEAEVREAGEERTVLIAPLAPNLNHRESVFGGSIATLAILSAWTWLHRFTRTRAMRPTLVIQEEKTRYVTPAVSEFTATCSGPPESDRERFLLSLKRYHRARLRLHSTVTSGETVIACFEGLFVAIDEGSSLLRTDHQS